MARATTTSITRFPATTATAWPGTTGIRRSGRSGAFRSPGSRGGCAGRRPMRSRGAGRRSPPESCASQLERAAPQQAAEQQREADAVPAEGREAVALEEAHEPAHRDRSRERGDGDAERHGGRAELLEQVRRALAR